MNIDDTAEEASYRAGIRGFLQDNLDRLVRHAHADPRTAEEVERYKETQQILYKGGLVGATWPAEYGGQDATSMQQVIINQELSRVGVPSLVGQIGLGMCGPTIIVHGTPEQKAQHLQRLLEGTDVWSQLFSEPGAGSDLAGISTRAVPVEGGWCLNGQKVWTSGAHYSSWGIVLARTDPTVAKHRGLTMFIIDMRAPGITIRPLRQLTGHSHFNEVFLDDAFIPENNLLGPVNGGWGVALTTLMNERMALGGAGEFGGNVDALLALASHKFPDLHESTRAVIRQDIGRLYALTLAVRWTGFRRLTALSRGETPGPEASAGKLVGTAIVKEMVQTAAKMLGPDAAFAANEDGSDHWQYMQGSLPGWALAGGASEILKNILGERVLGLPPEPRVDKAPPAAAANGSSSDSQLQPTGT